MHYLVSAIIFGSMMAASGDTVAPNRPLASFAAQNGAAFEEFFSEDRDRYVGLSFTAADEFILNILNEHALDGSLSASLESAGGNDFYEVTDTTLAICLPDSPSVDGYAFMFYRMPDPRRPTYLLRHGDLIEIDPEKAIYFGYGTLRVVSFHGGKYSIEAKIEDTNFSDIFRNRATLSQSDKERIAKELDDPLGVHPCRDLEGDQMPIYACHGDRIETDKETGEVFSMRADGTIHFTTYGLIPPTRVQLHKYRINWEWDPKSRELRAKTLQWNIHEEPLPDGSDTRTVEKTIELGGE